MAEKNKFNVIMPGETVLFFNYARNIAQKAVLVKEGGAFDQLQIISAFFGIVEAVKHPALMLIVTAASAEPGLFVLKPMENSMTREQWRIYEGILQKFGLRVEIE